MSSRENAGWRTEEHSEQTTDRCPECEGEVATEHGETVCTDCGLVVEEYRFDHRGPRVCKGEVGKRRSGPPITAARHDRGISTSIGRGSDGQGNELSGSKRLQMHRLRREHSRARVRSKAERNLITAFTEIARLCSALELPRAVREEAATIHRRAKEEDLLLGRSIETFATAAVHATCRCGDHVRTLEEIAEVARCSEEKIKLGYRILNQEVGLEAAPPRPKEKLARLASKVGAPVPVERRAAELAELARESGIANGRKPSGVAGACLYLAGREQDCDLTQDEVADAAGVSRATIRARFYELLEETGRR